MTTLRADRAVGFRVEPKCVHFAVVDGPAASPRLDLVETRKAPRSFDASQALAWYANEVRSLCSNSLPSVAWVREAEQMAKVKRDLVAQRARIEGAIIAVANALGLRVTLGRWTTITAHLKPERTSTGKKMQAKSYLSTDEFRGIDWSPYDANQREAILVAVAGLSS